jgi:NAD(P)-dependent dehydrogenase (short-subunit alcohol dehydrogenase family)
LPKRRSEKTTLQGKTALITGATQGIGLAITHALASEGCNLVICGRSQTRLKKAKAELSSNKVRVLAAQCDVRDERSVREVFTSVRKQIPELDILINNAGIAHASRPARELAASDWNDVIATNLTGVFLVTKAALPLMKRGAIIVNNLSIAAKRVFPGSSAYNASKHGALGFTNTLREELREQGIRVIALLPGATNTSIWETLWSEAPREKMMSSETVARALVAVLKLPPDATVEELIIRPTAGTL